MFFQIYVWKFSSLVSWKDFWDPAILDMLRVNITFMAAIPLRPQSATAGTSLCDYHAISFLWFIFLCVWGWNLSADSYHHATGGQLFQCSGQWRPNQAAEAAGAKLMKSTSHLHLPTDHNVSFPWSEIKQDKIPLKFGYISENYNYSENNVDWHTIVILKNYFVHMKIIILSALT